LPDLRGQNEGRQKAACVSNCFMKVGRGVSEDGCGEVGESWRSQTRPSPAMVSSHSNLCLTQRPRVKCVVGRAGWKAVSHTSAYPGPGAEG
jgi:hypothetical protein